MALGDLEEEEAMTWPTAQATSGSAAPLGSLEKKPKPFPSSQTTFYHRRTTAGAGAVPGWSPEHGWCCKLSCVVALASLAVPHWAMSVLHDHPATTSPPLLV